MAAIQNLVLKDRATTPVDHTFVPAGKLATDVVKVQEAASGGVPNGASTYTVGTRRTPTGNHKVTLKLDVPVVVTESINGVSVSKVARVARAEATFTFSGDSTTAERNNLVGMFADSLATSKVLVNDSVVNLNAPY